MFSGLQEILLILLIVLAIFLIPRIASRRQAPQKSAIHAATLPVFSRSLRLGIVLSLLWLAAWAIYLKPWHDDVTVFSTVGIGPVALGWGIKWVLAGKKNKR